MNRAINYPRRAEALEVGAEDVAPEAPPDQVDKYQVDKYTEKLVKYVPAEVIAFFIPGYALVKGQGGSGGWIVLALGLLGTVGYLFVRADPDSRPRAYFYLLAALAFIGWAFGTTGVGTDLLGLAEWMNDLSVLTAVFLIPLADEVLTKVTSHAQHAQ